LSEELHLQFCLEEIINWFLSYRTIAQINRQLIHAIFKQYNNNQTSKILWTDGLPGLKTWWGSVSKLYILYSFGKYGISFVHVTEAEADIIWSFGQLQKFNTDTFIHLGCSYAGCTLKTSPEYVVVLSQWHYLLMHVCTYVRTNVQPTYYWRWWYLLVSWNGSLANIFPAGWFRWKFGSRFTSCLKSSRGWILG
jgi:hypothetical protein